MAAVRSTYKGLTGKAAFHAIKEHGYRSTLEKKMAEQLKSSGIEWSYETEKLKYVIPEREATYTPDFPLGKPTKIYLEGKGYFRDPAERQKMILVKANNPDVDIRFVFQNANKPIYKGSPTTHGDWCEKHGFKYSDKGIVPQEWLDEITAQRSANPSAS